MCSGSYIHKFKTTSEDLKKNSFAETFFKKRHVVVTVISQAAGSVELWSREAVVLKCAHHCKIGHVF